MGRGTGRWRAPWASLPCEGAPNIARRRAPAPRPRLLLPYAGLTASEMEYIMGSVIRSRWTESTLAWTPSEENEAARQSVGAARAGGCVGAMDPGRRSRAAA